MKNTDSSFINGRPAVQIDGLVGLLNDEEGQGDVTAQEDHRESDSLESESIQQPAYSIKKDNSAISLQVVKPPKSTLIRPDGKPITVEDMIEIAACLQRNKELGIDERPELMNFGIHHCEWTKQLKKEQDSKVVKKSDRHRQQILNSQRALPSFYRKS